MPAKELLSNKGIEFDYFDIRKDEEANARFKEIRRILIHDKKYDGPLGVPTYVIGDEILVGIDEEKIFKAIEKLSEKDNFPSI